MKNRSDFANLESQSRLIGFDAIQSELDASFTFASVAATEYETGNTEAAEHSYASARKRYKDVIGLLSERHELSAEQIHSLDPRLGQGKGALPRLKELARQN